MKRITALKLYHTIGWVIFIILLIVSGQFLNSEMELSEFVFAFFITFSVLLLVFYSNYLYFVPKYLINHKRYFLYFLSVILIILMGMVSSMVGTILKDITFGNPINILDHFTTASQGIFTFIIFIIISLTSRLAIERSRERIKQAEYRAHLQRVELELLKAKLNPHFLYNSLNTLYALSNKAQSNVSAAILQLADIMRYVTYSSSTEMSTIHEELDFIEAYIEFQKYRIPNADQKIIVRINRPTKNYRVSSLLLLTFMENAIKHTNLVLDSTFITITFEPTQNGFTYIVENEPIIQEKGNERGIGLSTLEKTLWFNYPNTHRMQLHQLNEKHVASLTIKSIKDEMYCD